MPEAKEAKGTPQPVSTPLRSVSCLMSDSRPGTPEPVVQPQSEPPEPQLHESTVEDLEAKLRELELRFLGKESPQPPTPALSPFTPACSLSRRISEFKA